jgi:hypothetical protein
LSKILFCFRENRNLVGQTLLFAEEEPLFSARLSFCWAAVSVVCTLLRLLRKAEKKVPLSTKSKIQELL